MDKFNNINIGDVILAKRYRSEKEGENIARGHRKGPYVITRIEDDCAYGFYCSSREPTDNQKIKHYVLDINQADFAINKVTYVCSNYENKITEDQYVCTIGHLTKKDILGIQKLRMALSVRKSEAKEYNYHCTKYNAIHKSGDIIRLDNKLYFIHSKYDRNYYAHPIKIVNEFGYDTCNGIKFEIIDNYSKRIPDGMLSTFESLYFVDKKTLNTIFDNQREKRAELSSSPHTSNIAIGNLIRHEGDLYYIFDNTKDVWKTYKVYPNTRKVTNCVRFEIQNGRYLSFLERKDISITPDKTACKIASPQQINSIQKIIDNGCPKTITLYEKSIVNKNNT